MTRDAPHAFGFDRRCHSSILRLHMGIVDRLAAALAVPAETLWQITGTLVVLLLWGVVGRLGKRLIARAVEDPSSRFRITRATGYVVGVIATVLIVRMWIQGLAGIATYFGLLSAGVAIALQDPLTNIAGWLFIILRRPFRVGDRIQLGTYTGDVVDIRPLGFAMLEVGNWVHADQGTGRVLHVPNGFVFKNTVANFDEPLGYIWNELEITVTFESDWRTAKETLQKILDAESQILDAEVKKRVEASADAFHIRVPKLTPIVWTTVVERGVMLTMRYLCKPRARRSSSSAIWERVLDALNQLPNVAIAYPTTRRFDNISEGKPAIRAVVSSSVPPARARD
ncbi:MAG TPA: mechanosensitive ion channel domain-containing protein [Labilithrix sp.]|nr:mechanosensitive ion channel domain-containing protein [Labilithrix sp.]